MTSSPATPFATSSFLDLSGRDALAGEVVNGEESMFFERPMPSRPDSQILALELDPETGEVVARLGGKRLFQEPIYSDLQGSVLLLPPETRTGLDIIISQTIH